MAKAALVALVVLGAVLELVPVELVSVPVEALADLVE